MGRPPLAIGTYGSINTREERRADGKLAVRARARYRDLDGVTRPVVRYGPTVGKARDALKLALVDRQRRDTASAINPDTRVADLAQRWYTEPHDWTPNTRETYRYAIAVVVPVLGQVRLAEMRPAVLNRGISRILEDHGHGAAKTAKTVLAGMFRLAVAHDALQGNPARDAISIPRPRKVVRALTRDETDELCDRMRGDAMAQAWDLPDLVEFMLGTGARIGEACAARDATIDLAEQTWEINATVVRIKGEGLTIQRRPKTAAGWRVLGLPSFVVHMIDRRRDELRFGRVEGVIFGSPRARALRDPSNTAKDLRDVLKRIDYAWVTSHTFRKTVITRLDEAGLSAREIADYAGHAKPSMTQDVYMGRRIASTAAPAILDR